MAEMTPERFDGQMRSLLPEGWTYGYIGNVWADGRPEPDDRSWRIFAPHPERVGTRNDCVGDFATKDRFELLPLARGIAFAFAFARANPNEARKILKS